MANASNTALRKALGRIIRDERSAQGLSLRKLGLMVGVDHKRLFQIEHGTANITFNTLNNIAEGLGIPLSVLLLRAEKSTVLCEACVDYAAIAISEANEISVN